MALLEVKTSFDVDGSLTIGVRTLVEGHSAFQNGVRLSPPAKRRKQNHPKGGETNPLTAALDFEESLPPPNEGGPIMSRPCSHQVGNESAMSGT